MFVYVYVCVVVLCSLLYVYYYRFFIVDIFFFFKQKTAYEMRISDWSSDVCSSDLPPDGVHDTTGHAVRRFLLRARRQPPAGCRAGGERSFGGGLQIGRASCRERVCQYV